MKITICSTSRIVDVNGVPARVWEGTTEKGVQVFALVTRVAAHKDADQAEFERDLVEQKPPSAVAVTVFPTRMIL